ncbi:hypothetical protein GH714_026899 [Hevea brasiliensis]|uniref:Disease resistance N-terminal domain-containing protein n=1 Tax=Hevea brasiliensis TaxID=3981 RepID=A0A6A6N6W6_HEVBR|nr:hypothetical protein GH714_026899 [Hevea brasiliensis]
MGLLLRLDSVPGFNPTVREARRRSAVGLWGCRRLVDGICGSAGHDWCVGCGFARDWNEVLAEMEREVSTIKAVLLHAEELSSENRQIKEWLSMLKDAFYDADDLLDELSLKALQKQVMTGTRMAKEVRLFFSSSNPFAYGLKMAHKIKAIRERLDEIAENRKFFLEERHEERRIAANNGRPKLNPHHLH